MASQPTSRFEADVGDPHLDTFKQNSLTTDSIAQALFDKLLADASQSRQHHGSGQACVKLCSFVQQCAKSSDKALKSWAFTEDLSVKLFHFYLEWYEHDPHRALRLVLDFLVTSSTQNPSPEAGRAIKEHILETLVLIITRKYPKLLTKSGLQCLDHFWTKRAFQFDDIGRKLQESEPWLGNTINPGLWRVFSFHLFSWMEQAYVGPLAGKCLVHAFRELAKSEANNANADSERFSVELWLGWLEDAHARYPGILEDLKNYVLVPIFKTDKPSALLILQSFNCADALSSQGMRSEGAFMLSLAALELGKRFGLVEEPNSSADRSPSTTHIVLEAVALDSFLSHPSLSVRSSAFSLLVSSQATTKPFSQTAFDLLKKHLASMHADYDAKFRNEVLGLTKGLIRRAKNIITVAQRNLPGPTASGVYKTESTADPAHLTQKRKPGPEAAWKDNVEAKDVLASHEAFIQWYMNFLKSELLPTASYQRHITALKATLLMLRLGKHAGAGDELDVEAATTISADASWTRLLLDLMLDPFDDVRESASTVLGLLSWEIVEAPTKSQHGPSSLLETLREFCSRAQTLADRTGRADHGDGAARSQGLLCRWLSSQDDRIDLASKVLQGLEDKISRAEKDLGHAALDNPVHGDFAAISFIWQVLASETYSEDQLVLLHQIYRRIFDCAKRIWFAVKHILCDDSPEGHLPEEMEEIEGLDTKDLLSYSFRAIHESSNLMRLMIGTLRLEPGPGVPFPPLDMFKQVGDLTFEQLAALRHRGAFSTVSLTFTTCCQLTQRLQSVYTDISGSENLLEEWYRGSLLCIDTQASTTRRSAGIPSLVAAILTANAESPSFEKVFRDLEEIGRKPALVAETDGSNLPQVHALNCLRGVFRSSLLSKKAESYLAVNLQLAANSLKSEVWAIRNCGLLLLRSLIDCLLGTGESKATMESGWDGHSVRISYNKYPTLPGVILSLLQSADKSLDEVSSSAAEAVFPALDIIRRAGPPDEHRAELRRYIEGYLGSRIWHVREIAGRTLCSFLLRDDWVVEISRLVVEGENLGANRLHGILLTTRFVIERKWDLVGDLDVDEDKLNDFLDLLADHVSAGRCPENEAALLEILNLLPQPKLRAEVETAVPPAQKTQHALLAMHSSLHLLYTTPSIPALSKHILSLLLPDIDGKENTTDVNTATRLLESLPSIPHAAKYSAQRDLGELYVSVITKAISAPEARAQALLNLANIVEADLTLRDRRLSSYETAFLSLETIHSMWSALQQKGFMNPTLTCAALRFSGVLMAQLTLESYPDSEVNPRLVAWGRMMLDALAIDNTFDTRHAAARSLRAFFLARPLSIPTCLRAPSSPYAPVYDNARLPAHLPALSALYTALIDDDDEIRDVAASAAAGVFAATFVPPAVADKLVAWLRIHLGCTAEFREEAVLRMTGQDLNTPVTMQSMVSAETQLDRALDFDDALFATEEQNLFVDEVRETGRWRGALFPLQDRGGPYGLGGPMVPLDGDGADKAVEKLVAWVEGGLRRMLEVVAEREDGPLGWTADQHVFAVCARVTMCAVAVEGIERGKVVKELLGRWREVAKGRRVHGALLELCG